MHEMHFEILDIGQTLKYLHENHSTRESFQPNYTGSYRCSFVRWVSASNNSSFPASLAPPFIDANQPIFTLFMAQMQFFRVI